ncbi:MAG: hypothetical protein QOC89_3144 [Paraburkholderia sp.]|uniref:hypothetical protein n=1 Tax=Paraburkholderia sp. TaxID=1926495 RepID=UPI002AFF2979|nr:hypothetical protein [Paraburkholderia sp.]MEA3085447.1 hypothetical protein [Paraburkholderia sp.]
MVKQKQQVHQGGDAAKVAGGEQSAQSAESRLDEALEESFPASDPIAVDMTEPSHSPPETEPSAGKKQH